MSEISPTFFCYNIYFSIQNSYKSLKYVLNDILFLGVVWQVKKTCLIKELKHFTKCTFYHQLCGFLYVSGQTLCKRVMLGSQVLLSGNSFISLYAIMPGRIAQSVGHLTRKSGVLGSIPGLATYFSFSFR